MKISVAPLMTIMMTTVSGFAPPSTTRPSATTVSMGLFDFLQPPKEEKPKAGSGKMDTDVFGGKGARITVREDEDVSFAVHPLFFSSFLPFLVNSIRVVLKESCFLCLH